MYYYSTEDAFPSMFSHPAGQKKAADTVVPAAFVVDYSPVSRV